MSLKILLVDDHQIMIDGILSILEEESTLTVVGQASTGRAAIDGTRDLQPDIVLMDLDMPDMNGILASQEIKAQYPNTKIIILSLHAEKSVIQHMIAIGIDGYLIKTSDKSEVVQAIKLVGEGGKYFSSAVTLSLTQQTSHSSNIILSSKELQEKLSLLSTREIEVIKLIADGLSNKEIGESLHLSHRTVDAHRANVMKKLDIKKVTGLVRFAVKVGIVD